MPEKIVDIIAKALLESDYINYIVRIQGGKGLQMQTVQKKHYNFIIVNIDSTNGHIIPVRQQRKKPKNNI